MTVSVAQDADTPLSYGDQAGILFYASDVQWVKLVVEGDKAHGCLMVVLALMPSNSDALARGAEAEATVCKIWSLGSDAPKSVRLQLELRRGDACCSVIASYDNHDAVELPIPFDCARFGVMAHLSREQQASAMQRWFHFRDFSGSA